MLDALGVRWGVTHAELKLTVSGPRVIEVNGRLGGDVADLCLRALDFDIIAEAGRVALNTGTGFAGPYRGSDVIFQFNNLAPASARQLVGVRGVRELRKVAGIARYSTRIFPGTSMEDSVGTQELDTIYGVAGSPGHLAAVLAEALTVLTFEFADRDGARSVVPALRLPSAGFLGGGVSVTDQHAAAGSTRTFLVLGLVDALGTGSFVSSNIVYFNTVLALSGGTVSAVLSLAGFVALVCLVPLGRWVDRLDARVVLNVGMCVAFLAYLVEGQHRPVRRRDVRDRHAATHDRAGDRRRDRPGGGGPGGGAREEPRRRQPRAVAGRGGVRGLRRDRHPCRNACARADQPRVLCGLCGGGAGPAGDKGGGRRTVAQNLACALIVAGCALVGLAAQVPVDVVVALVVAAVILLSFAELLQAAGAWHLSYELADDRQLTEYQSVFSLGVAAQSAFGPILVASVTVALPGGAGRVRAVRGGARHRRGRRPAPRASSAGLQRYLPSQSGRIVGALRVHTLGTPRSAKSRRVAGSTEYSTVPRTERVMSTP